jgi:ABC-type transporter Mla maintaining outer membrane lipid asymmetry ATPase subunit MlaF
VFEFSDRIAFMHQGKIALNGTVAEVMASKHENFTMFLQGRASGIDEPPTAAAAR